MYMPKSPCSNICLFVLVFLSGLSYLGNALQWQEGF